MAAIRKCMLWLKERLDWRELASLGVALAVLGLFLKQGRFLSPPFQFALGAIFLVALAVLGRFALPRLLGPVFFYDVVRTSRRSRYFMLRGGYAALLLVTLFVFYATWFNRFSMTELLSGTSVHADEVTTFADTFFSVFVSVQMGTIFLLTPVFSATSIAEEKEKRTLEFLLTTDLSGREIVLGKLVSRLANLALIVLAGLPILGFVQFLGGIDPNLVLAGFAVSGLTLVSVASLGVMNSVYFNRPREAIVVTYVEVSVFLVVTGLCCGAFANGPTPLNWASSGNIFVAMLKIKEAGAAGTLNKDLPLVVRDYAIFHLLAAFLLMFWAARMLRRESRKQVSGATEVVRIPMRKKGEYVMVRKPTYQAPPKYRPYLSAGDPMLWKEMYIDSGFRLSQLAVALAISLAGIVLYIAGAIFITGVLFSLAVGEWPSKFSNGWVRAVGTPVALLTLLAVAVRAAGSISSERERQTLDGLLTTPMDNRQILWAKWWASILSVRKTWWCLGAIWALGLFTGGVCPLAVPLLMIAWFVYAAFAAGVGLYFSLVSRTTLRATIWTLLTLLVVSIGHWVFGIFCNPLMFFDNRYQRMWLTEFHLYGLTPPWTLGWLAFYYGDFDDRYDGAEAWGRLSASLVGLACYGLAALLIWIYLKRRFGPVTGRVATWARPPVTYIDGQPQPQGTLTTIHETRPRDLEGEIPGMGETTPSA